MLIQILGIYCGYSILSSSASRSASAVCSVAAGSRSGVGPGESGAEATALAIGAEATPLAIVDSTGGVILRGSFSRLRSTDVD